METTETTLPTLTSPADRRAFVGTTLYGADSNNPELGCHYLVLKCGPTYTKLANVTFGEADGAHRLWHSDVRTDELAKHFRPTSPADKLYTR